MPEIKLSNGSMPHGIDGEDGLISVANSVDSPIPGNERQSFNQLLPSYAEEIHTLFRGGGAILKHEIVNWPYLMNFLHTKLKKDEVTQIEETLRHKQISIEDRHVVHKRFSMAVAPQTLGNIRIDTHKGFHFELYRDDKMKGMILPVFTTIIGEYFISNIWKPSGIYISPAAIASACLYDAIQKR